MSETENEVKIISGKLLPYEDSKTNPKIPEGRCLPPRYTAGTILEYPSGARYVVQENGKTLKKG